MGYLKYKGYIGSVEYSETDDCLFGKVLGLAKICITYEGNDIASLKADFEESVDEYLESCKKNNIEAAKPFKGNLNVRIGPERHCLAALRSKDEGITINAYINRALDYYAGLTTSASSSPRNSELS